MLPNNRVNLWNILPGLLVAPFYLIHGPWLYHENSLKLALCLGVVTLLWAFVAIKMGRTDRHPSVTPVVAGLFLLIPSIVGIPGALIFELPYSFPYEMGTDLLCVAWAVGVLYLGRTSAFFSAQMGIGFACFAVGLIALGSNMGIWPMLMEEKRLSFGNPNYGAAAVLVVLPLYLVFAMPTREAKWKWHWSAFNKTQLFLVIVCLLLLVILGSRAGLFLGTAVLIALLIAIYCREYRSVLNTKVTKRIYIGLLGCIGVASVSTGFVFRDNIRALGSISTWEGRLIPWGAAWESFKAAPVFGHGLGSSYGLFFQYVSANYLTWRDNLSYNHAHSEHLQTLQETGVVGYGIIISGILLLIALLLRKWITSHPGGTQGRLALALAASIVLFYMHGLVSVAQRMVVANLPFYLSVGVAIALVSKNYKWPAKKSFKTTYAISLGFVLISGAAIFLIPWFSKQFRHVNAVIVYNTQPDEKAYKRYIDELKDLNDVYAVYDALTVSSKRLDAKNGLYLAERLASMMPLYRRLNYYQALLQAIDGRKNEALRTLSNEPARTSGNTKALALQAILSADSGNFTKFRQSCEQAIYFAVLQPGEFGRPQDVDATIVNRSLKGGLVSVQSGEQQVEIRLHMNWVKSLYTHFTELGHSGNDPVNDTLQLVAGSDYGRLPLLEPDSTTQEQIQVAYKQYLEFRNLGIRSTSVNRTLKTRKGNKGTDSDFSRKLVDELEKIAERREVLSEQMSEIVDLELLAKRQKTVNFISEFVTELTNHRKMVLAD